MGATLTPTWSGQAHGSSVQHSSAILVLSYRWYPAIMCHLFFLCCISSSYKPILLVLSASSLGSFCYSLQGTLSQGFHPQPGQLLNYCANLGDLGGDLGWSWTNRGKGDTTVTGWRPMAARWGPQMALHMDKQQYELQKHVLMKKGELPVPKSSVSSSEADIGHRADWHTKQRTNWNSARQNVKLVGENFFFFIHLLSISGPGWQATVSMTTNNHSKARWSSP